ncbi:MAG: response regulator, partial [Bacteroidales bacterium]|nr:response regulator [Bacteroidales bacterium]
IKELEDLYVCMQNNGITGSKVRMIQEFLNFNTVFEEEVVFSVKNNIEKSAVFKSAILPGREDSWDTVLVALIDLTEITHLDSQVKVLLQAISHSPASIVITDTDGKIEYVNPKFTEVTGYSFEEASGKDPSILKSGKMSQEVYKDLWDTITSGGEWIGELLNRNKAGDLYWELASISAVKNDQGKVTHFVAIKEDITEQKKTEMRLRDAKQKAEESDGLKTAFLANMSHEIRTPMNAIVGFSELLRTSNVQGVEREEYFNIINTSCRTLSNLIDDIIDLAKIESGQTKIVEEACQPSVIMKELQLYFSEEVQKSGKALRIVMDFDFPSDLVTKTDEFRLRQVLTNLLGNSFKFTDKGLISWGARLIDNEEIEFYVKDTGIGIEKEHLESIFERFRQLDGSSVRKYEGTGLGLSVSKSLVELLGGRIWVDSEVGKGSEFKFTIPIRYVKGSTMTPDDISSSKGKDLFDWEGYNILVVEDNVSNFEFLKAVLSKTKSNILWAETGPSAIEIFKENENIHLVLMDIQIPELDGYETTREILKINPDVPVIAQTAFAMSRDREKSLEAGCIDYISKPIKPLDLLNLMEKYIPVVK